MAKGGRGGRRGGGGGSGGLPATTISASNIPLNATAMTDAEADKIRQDQDSQYDASTKAAIKMYISNTNFDGQGHSMSQSMNYALDQDIDFATADAATINRKLGTHFTANDVASMAYTDAYMNAAMHPLGKDTILQRGAHDDLLRDVFGISDYTKMSESQLQAALVGQGFRTKSHMSTSYDMNKNPFLGKGSGVSGGREVVYNIKAGANTRCVFGAKAQSEIVLGKGTDFRITGVHYSGQTASPRGKGSRPQLVIDIETI